MMKNIINESKAPTNDKRLLIRRHMLESIERLDTWFICFNKRRHEYINEFTGAPQYCLPDYCTNKGVYLIPVEIFDNF
jgi:hypothetical protein